MTMRLNECLGDKCPWDIRVCSWSCGGLFNTSSAFEPAMVNCLEQLSNWSTLVLRIPTRAPGCQQLWVAHNTRYHQCKTHSLRWIIPRWKTENAVIFSLFFNSPLGITYGTCSTSFAMMHSDQVASIPFSIEVMNPSNNYFYTWFSQIILVFIVFAHSHSEFNTWGRIVSSDLISICTKVI